MTERRLSPAQRQMLWRVADGFRVDDDHEWTRKTVAALIERGLLDESRRLTAEGRRIVGR